MKLDSIKNYSLNTRIAYKNLEDYNKGAYKSGRKIINESTEMIDGNK